MPGSITDQIEQHLRTALGSQPQRASVTFLGVEAIDVLRFVSDPGGTGDASGETVYVTLGCARHPMNPPEELHPDATAGPRAELVVRLHASVATPGLHRRLATLAAAPSVEGLVLGTDALLDLGEPVWDGSPFTALVTGPDELADLPLTDVGAEPVRFLRAIPVTANEAAWMRLKGVDALREAWDEAGMDLADPRRAAAKL